MSFNKITVVGFLGRDPELRYTPTGNAVCNFSVATTEKQKDKEFTTWFRVTAWGRQGELCNEWLKKGSQVYVEGRLRMEEYTDRDGNKRTNLEVNASDIQFLGKKTEGGFKEEGADFPISKPQGGYHETLPDRGADPRPKTLGELVSPKQLWMIRNLAREAGADAEQECLKQFKCNLEEINKQAASSLIEYFQGKGGGAAVKKSDLVRTAEDDSEIPF